MNWKKALSYLLETKKWQEALDLMANVVKSDDTSVDAYINYLYILEAIPLEPEVDYLGEMARRANDALFGVYEEARSKYSDNPDFLFWSGWLATWCEWLFKIDLRDAELLMLKSYVMRPENKLFGLAMVSNRKYTRDGAYEDCIREIMSDKDTVNYIEKRGPVGEYMLYLFRPHCQNGVS